MTDRNQTPSTPTAAADGFSAQDNSTAPRDALRRQERILRRRAAAAVMRRQGGRFMHIQVPPPLDAVWGQRKFWRTLGYGTEAEAVRAMIRKSVEESPVKDQPHSSTKIR